MGRKFLSVMVVLLLLSPHVFAQRVAAADEPPVANRVEPFSGAVGRKFTVTMTISPTELKVGEMLALTVRVAAEGPWQRPPQRPDLRRHEKYAHFPRRFHIENGANRHDPAKQTWEFRYRLRPLAESVRAIPRLPFVYFKPGYGYQTTSAPAIDLTVRPRAEVSPADVQGAVGPLRLPERFYEIAEGPTVLRRDSPPALPGPTLLVLLLTLPPALCACWFVMWRWRYPEVARLARQRRSRAAQHALQALRRAGRGTPDFQAQRATEAVTEYLRQRFELTVAEPTPGEVAAPLSHLGLPSEVVGAVAEFYRACDAVRFADADLGDATQKAAALILALEAAPCPATAS